MLLTCLQNTYVEILISWREDLDIKVIRVCALLSRLGYKLANFFQQVQDRHQQENRMMALTDLFWDTKNSPDKYKKTVVLMQSSKMR